MTPDIKSFQSKYGLSNKDMADICGCSLPTIQKWRSGEVSVSGAAAQLMRILELNAEGSPDRLRQVLGRMDQAVQPGAPSRDAELDQLENSMNKVVDRLELMLESRRKDKELAESEARYRSMVESSIHPVCRWLPDTTLTYVNEAYARIFGQEPASLVGRKWLELVPDGRRHEISALVSDMVRRGEEESMVHESIGKDGRMTFQEWKDVPVKDTRGDVVEFHSIGQDVTELMRLRREVDELRAAKRALVSLSEQPVLIFNQAGDFLEMNEPFRVEILGGKDGSTNLADVMEGAAVGKLKRLVRRLSGDEEICFRMRINNRSILLLGCLLSRQGDTARYLACFKDHGALETSPVMKVRLERELFLDGRKRRISMDDVARDRIEQRMEALGKAVHVDRLYVFTLDDVEEVFDNILEWCAEGVTAQIDNLQRIPMSEYPWWIERVRKRQWIQIEDTSKLPRSAAVEREILTAQDICSVLVAPLELHGKVAGFVGFDHNHTPRIWHEQEKRELDAFRKDLQLILGQNLLN